MKKLEKQMYILEKTICKQLKFINATHERASSYKKRVWPFNADYLTKEGK